ncbi:MAG TPA: hypothetical protein VEL74_17345 [Thermoanaerobaculia bacterium]|nr:hypothetical protein [Thermoanaerobaculia bacterium]
MKRGLLLSVLVAALGLAGWVTGTPRAEASGFCDASEGLSCSPAGDMFNCFWSTGERGFCFCEPVAGQPGYYWVCGTGKP